VSVDLFTGHSNQVFKLTVTAGSRCWSAQ